LNQAFDNFVDPKVLTLLFLSSVAYGFVKQSDMVNQHQTWLGMLSATGLSLLVQLVIFYFAFTTRRRTTKSEGGKIQFTF